MTLFFSSLFDQPEENQIKMRKEAETSIKLPGIGECSLDVARAAGGLSSLFGYPALVLSAHVWKILHPSHTLGLEAL